LEVAPQALGPKRGRTPSPLQIPGALSGPRPCPSCGGSGVLRLSARRFRTCLDCAGQGVLPVVAASSSFEPLPQLGQALNQLMASARGGQGRLPAEEPVQDLAN